MAIPLTIKVFKGETLVTSQDFERDIIKIGRLSSAHLRLDDETVSRVHSVLEASADGSLSVIDMGSVEGTYVNGKRVNKGRVTFGDEIRLGGTTLRLENPAAVAAVNLASAVASTEVPVQVAAVTPEVTLPPAPAPTPAVEPSPTLSAQPELASTPAEVPLPQPAPRIREHRTGRASGPMGVSLSFVWGDQRVGEFFLPPDQKKSFTAGSAQGVDFVMGDSRLGSPRLEVLRTDGQTYTVCFTGKMKGELIRDAETLTLEAVIESGKASHEDTTYILALQTDDVFWVDLGGVTLEVCFQPVPKRVHVPLAESVDYRALNIFLVMFFAATMFVISAMNRTGGDESFADELSGDQSRLTKLIIKQSEPQKNHFLAKLNEQKEQKRATTQKPTDPQRPLRRTQDKQRTSTSTMTSKDKAQALVKNLLGGPGKGLANLFGSTGKGNELKNAVSNVSAMLGTPGGFGTLVTKSGPGGPGGGTGSTIGLGPLGTQGRAGGNQNYGTPTGLTGKQSVDVAIAASEPEIKEGTLDKDLVRKVIQDHKQQIRACFESLLNQYPDLNGKVQTQFTIGPQGQVLQSKVAQSSTGSRELDSCVANHVRLWEFPKPKGGGIVVVSYPFIFKQSGR
ncbi:adventurous gliding motility protein GltG [Hyalangium versicolor]|uniref:adventurous gliding motility protein GltG n=1 Tax=Hyalangium versicolor TaxID=2861190 RepID=UPI001CCD9F39|nr:adventurous gliding motility protein GltG [Hyalangium versicolor]